MKIQKFSFFEKIYCHTIPIIELIFHLSYEFRAHNIFHFGYFPFIGFESLQCYSLMMFIFHLLAELCLI